jgi:hypothetical protein
VAVTVHYGSRHLVVEPVTESPEDAVCYLGRGGVGEHTVWIRLTRSDTSLPRRAVAISCPMEGVWQLRRVSERVGVEARFPDGSRFVVPSDRWRLMPADESEAFVIVESTIRSYEFVVRVGRDGDPYVGPDGGDDTETRVAIKADPDIGYFRVCVELCRPKLQDPFNDALPTEPEIVDRLVRSGIEPLVTLKSVQRRLESVRSKLDVMTNRELRDRLVASRAVTPAHLDLHR